ncbi:hypothetical protein [Micromonospora sp. U21]|uniref:hypothetical protein n=1 Tax=Micromonospora sp. U21 TaxID=2824899 RepID=UPI0027DC3114|nr:hypothetical protein [Micromonospora sp. U21]
MDSTRRLSLPMRRSSGGDDANSDDKPVSQGEQLDAVERETAKRRLLAQAEAERIPVEETTRALPDRRWRGER